MATVVKNESTVTARKAPDFVQVLCIHSMSQSQVATTEYTLSACR